jgi:hypothetical protein
MRGAGLFKFWRPLRASNGVKGTTNMTIRERERRAEQRRQSLNELEQRHSQRLHPDQILSFRQWCELNNISERTGARILASPDGPVVVQLSAKRIGIRVSDNRAWQASRVRSSATLTRGRGQRVAKCALRS